MNIIRRNKNESYSVICNHALRNPQLSLKAKGLFAYIMTLPDSWEIFQSELVKHSKDGLDSHRGALAELEEFGYLSRQRLRDKKGKLAGIEYTIRETPKVGKSHEKPAIEQKTVGFTQIGKSYVGETQIGKSYVGETQIGKSQAIKYLPIVNTNENKEKEINKEKSFHPLSYMEEFYFDGIENKGQSIQSLLKDWIKIKSIHPNATLDPNYPESRVLSKGAMKREINLINKLDPSELVHVLETSIQKKYQGLFTPNKKQAPAQSSKQARPVHKRLHDCVKTSLEEVTKKRVKGNLSVFINFYEDELLGTEQEKRARIKAALKLIKDNHGTEYFPVVVDVDSFILKFEKIEAAGQRNKKQVKQLDGIYYQDKNADSGDPVEINSWEINLPGKN